MYRLVRPNPMLYMSWVFRWTASPCYTPLKRAAKPPRFAPPRTEPWAMLDLCSITYLSLLSYTTSCLFGKNLHPEGRHKANTSSREWQRKPPFWTTSSQELLTTSPGNLIMFIYIVCNTLFVIPYSKVSFSNSHGFWPGLSSYVTIETSMSRSCNGADETLEDNTVNCLPVWTNLGIRSRLQGFSIGSIQLMASLGCVDREWWICASIAAPTKKKNSMSYCRSREHWKS